MLKTKRAWSVILSIAALMLLLPTALTRGQVSAHLAVSAARSVVGPPLVVHSTIATIPNAGTLHTPSLVDLGNGELLCVWYTGSDEGARDVGLYAARFMNGRWQSPVRITDGATTGKELGRFERTVGNAILLLRPQGEVWLVYVSVTIGGWSGSRLNLKRSRDSGRTWSQAERLVTSPFFNLSTLVRGNPLELTNGLPAIPAYHEFVANIPEVVILNTAGQVIDKIRIGASAGRLAIQPTVAVLSESAAIALMRPLGSIKRVYQSRSRDGGRSWTLPRPTELSNPGAPVGAVASGGESLLLVFNNDTKAEKNLTLAVSDDAGLTWDHLIVLDQLGSNEKRGLSYPYLTTGANGTYHLVYTHRAKNEVRHIQFNAAWVRSLLAAAGTGSDGIRHPCLAC